MSCECYQIGGPWITYDPSCPAHGDDAQRAEKEAEQEATAREEAHLAELAARDTRIAALEKCFGVLKDTPLTAIHPHDDIVWIKVKDTPPRPGMIVKKFKNGSVWAGKYSGTEKELSFVEYIQLPD